jgi:hypothetical protein
VGINEARIRAQRRNAGSRQLRSPQTDESPIQVSTPPVRIIGTGRRHTGGFHLSDR